MSIWGTIVSKLKEVLSRMIGRRTIEQTLHLTPVISSQMESAINLWTDMYKDQAPWLQEPSLENPAKVVSLGLPALIASEKARMALLEFNSEITAPMQTIEVENPNYTEPLEGERPSAEPRTYTDLVPIGNTERADFLSEQYKKLKRQLRKQLEYGIAKGGLVIKPYVIMPKSNDSDIEAKPEIEFDFIQADAFFPLSFSASGRTITEAAFIQSKVSKDIVYRKLEYHKWENNVITVINKAFKSTNHTTEGDMSGIDLGQEVPLSEVSEWASLQDITTIKNVDRPLFAYFRMPDANTIDTSSPLGVSGFSRAVRQIREADEQYSRLLWEYEGGELAIDIDRDALKEVQGADGMYHTKPNRLQERLFRPVDLGNEDTYQPFAPSLRDSNYIDGLNTILMRIEDICCLSRGSLSDAADIARTATELKILKQRSYQSNSELQVAIEDTLRDVIYIMDTYCSLYEITPAGEYDVNFEWDDSIIVDMDKELEKRITLMQSGIVSKLENRMWYFGETERQAQEALTKINEEILQSEANDVATQYFFVNKNDYA